LAEVRDDQGRRPTPNKPESVVPRLRGDDGKG